MEVANGVEVEISNAALLEANQMAFELSSNVNKENEVNDNKVDVLDANNGDAILAHEDIATSVALSEETTSVSPEINVSAKKIGHSKALKDGEGRNGNKKNPRAGLSQSMSFSGRGSIASTIKKSSTSVKKTEGDVKKPQSSNSERVNGGASARLIAGAKKSVPVKFGSVDHGSRSESMKSNNGNLNPLKQTTPAKNDDDTNSNTSSTTPSGMPRRRSTGSGFSFRLDDRAEKRKEFFSKLEEKIHAKEMEKTNLQEKSKESQEAEIRRLRKSLTFKATPMPNFYQEPGPPKVELKKIPPTRARSPKLGRDKSTTAVAASSPSDAGISSPTTNPTKSNIIATNGNGSSTVTKKPAQKLIAKIPSQKSTATKPDAKPKPKMLNQKQRTDKTKEESDKPIDQEPQTEIHVKVEEGNETNPDSSESVVTPNEVIDAPDIATEAPLEI